MDPKKSQSYAYRKVVLHIGKALTSGEIHDCKFLCKDLQGFTQMDFDEISDGKAFVTKLEQIDALSQENVDFVADILNFVNRNDLERELKQYKMDFIDKPPVGQVGGYVAQPMSAQYHPQNDGLNSGMYSSQNQPQIMGDDLSQDFDIIVANIGRDWRQLARQLRLTEVDIECITENHSRNLREQSRQALWMWKNNQRQAASKASLVAALRKCRMNYIADIVEGYIQQ